MILHIVRDEKVINRAIQSFETVFPRQNLFVVLVPDIKNARYVKSRECVRFEIYNTQSFWETIGDINSYDSIVVHYLISDSVDFVISISHPNIYWIEWGSDLYNALLAKRGYKMYYDPDVVYHYSDTRLPLFLYKIKYFFMKYQNKHKIMKAIKKVKYFVPDSMYDEYPLLLQYYPEFKHLVYKEFFYYPIDEVLGDSFRNENCEGNNIVVGHSAGLTENYEYVFNVIKTLKLGGRHIICPLSYGNSKYRDKIVELGKQLFCDNFVPLVDFMPLDEYNQILKSANIFIYGNWRQEAVGNILVALYLGGKVYLDSRNPLYQFYKGLGLLIFSLDDLNDSNIDSTLTKEQVASNREIINNYYSKERQLLLIKENFINHE